MDALSLSRNSASFPSTTAVPPLFIGIDLAWGARATTAAATLQMQQNGMLLCTAQEQALTSNSDIAEWLQRQDEGQSMLLGIDAPLRVPNLQGERPCESILRRCFQKYQAGPHPANRTLFRHRVRGEELVALLSEKGFSDNPHFSRKEHPLRRCLEVFPHPAHVVLFGLQRTLKYKARQHRSLAERMDEYERLIEGLKSLQHYTPALQPPAWLLTPRLLKGSALKQYEDLLDALMCAYVAAWYYHHGPGPLCAVAGSWQTGYIITPATPELAACLQQAQQNRTGVVP